MPRTFKLPHFYQSPIISVVKQARRDTDTRTRDLSPSVLDFGPVRFKIARHFGFCYGVENAIEIAYQALAENPDKRIFLLSEIIHNPRVNENLRQRGVQFLMDTTGTSLISFDVLTPDDVVIVPAFGTTLEIEQVLKERGVILTSYNTTCPFVEKVWRRSEEIGKQDYTVVIHGKHYHEETRATFSHAQAGAPVIVVRDIAEARNLAKVISGEAGAAFFFEKFKDRFSNGFDPEYPLETARRCQPDNDARDRNGGDREICCATLSKRLMVRLNYPRTSPIREIRSVMRRKRIRDATLALIADGGDVAVVVGGYNSSNTSHLVALCQQHLPPILFGMQTNF